jgi:hypothetical protein
VDKDTTVEDFQECFGEQYSYNQMQFVSPVAEVPVALAETT